MRPDQEPPEQLADDGRLTKTTGDLLPELGPDEQHEHPEQDIERCRAGPWVKQRGTDGWRDDRENPGHRFGLRRGSGHTGTPLT